jgi:hypothetical protein
MISANLQRHTLVPEAPPAPTPLTSASALEALRIVARVREGREAAFAFRSAVRRKQENRGLFLCTSDLAILSAIMAGSLFCKVTKERFIVLAAGAAVMLACKMQKLVQGLERKRGRDGTHNLYRVLQSRIASLFPSNE